MKKSGNTLTDQYKFKRLLKTSPAILRLYKQKFETIDSISAVKDIAIFDIDESADPNSQQAILLSKNESGWPRRIEFPEQVAEIADKGLSVWTIIFIREVSQNAVPRGCLNIIQTENPAIGLAYDRLGPNRKFTPIEENSLDNIEQTRHALFYLYDVLNVGDASNPRAIEMRTTGILPASISLYNATFYDRDVAYLYADSLCEEMKTQMQIQVIKE